MNNDLRKLGRAKNSLLGFFEKSLYVPKIYLDATWDGHQVDLLAIDRDGSGDVHVALIFPSIGVADSNDTIQRINDEIHALLDRLSKISAQYKYIAAVDVSSSGTDPLSALPHQANEDSFAADGLGRVGFFTVQFAEGEPQVRNLFKAERFRAFVSTLAGEYVQNHQADWEIRP